jgi:hypothetical protein
MAIRKAQRGSVIKQGRPISAKRAKKKMAKGKGYISKPIPNTQKSPGSFVKTKPNKKGPLAGFTNKIVGKSRPIKKAQGGGSAPKSPTAAQLKAAVKGTKKTSPKKKKVTTTTVTRPKAGTYGGTNKTTRTSTKTNKKGVTTTKSKSVQSQGYHPGARATVSKSKVKTKSAGRTPWGAKQQKTISSKGSNKTMSRAKGTKIAKRMTKKK